MKKNYGYWKSPANQRQFFDDLGKKFGISSAKEWGKLKRDDIIQVGGRGILNHYNRSLYRALKTIYSEIEWKKEWFQVPVSPKYWSNLHHQRQFIENLAKTLNIKSPSDWGRVTRDEVIKHGGSGLLNHYNDSLFKALLSLYKNINWKKEWFSLRKPKNFWMEKMNQKIFLDKIILQNEITNPKEWNKVRRWQIKLYGGSSLFNQYDGLFESLSSVYSETNWKKDWFTWKRQYKSEFWESKSNQRKFMEEFASRMALSSPYHWQKVSKGLIQKAGGQGLLNLYGSLRQALKSIYPEHDWGSVSPNSEFLGQNLLTSQLNQLFPQTMFSNFRNHL